LTGSRKNPGPHTIHHEKFLRDFTKSPAWKRKKIPGPSRKRLSRPPQERLSFPVDLDQHGRGDGSIFAGIVEALVDCLTAVLAD